MLPKKLEAQDHTTEATEISLTPWDNLPESSPPLQVKSPTSTSNSSETFINFPKLPYEIRLVIWNLACKPRLVIWGYSGAGTPLPGAVQACQESRNALRKRYQSYKRPVAHIPGRTYTLLIDMERDVLVRKCALPQINIEPLSDECLLVVRPKLGWLRPLKRLAVKLDDVACLHSWGDLQVCTLRQIVTICPNLVELMVICYGKVRRRDTMDDLTLLPMGYDDVLAQQHLSKFKRLFMRLVGEILEASIGQPGDEHLRKLELSFVVKARDLRITVVKPRPLRARC